MTIKENHNFKKYAQICSCQRIHATLRRPKSKRHPEEWSMSKAMFCTNAAHDANTIDSIFRLLIQPSLLFWHLSYVLEKKRKGRGDRHRVFTFIGVWFSSEGFSMCSPSTKFWSLHTYALVVSMWQVTTLHQSRSLISAAKWFQHMKLSIRNQQNSYQIKPVGTKNCRVLGRSRCIWHS